MTKPVIDTSVLEQQLGGDNEFLSEVIKDYLKQREQISARIQAALAQGALNEVSGHAHQLKGSLLTLGAGLAADAAFQVEKLSHEQKADETRGAVVALEAALDTLAPELEKLARHGFHGS